MMTINADTKIAAILKQNAKALDAIISLNPKFDKLRNPILRNLMAGRTSIAMAAKVGDCTPEDFFSKLRPLGFEIDGSWAAGEVKKEYPAFLEAISPEQVTVLDVRPILASGRDPLKDIMAVVKSIKPGHVLKIVNTFEPTPLMALLAKQGFETYADAVEKDLIETYFYKTAATADVQPAPEANTAGDWEQLLSTYEHDMQTLDVRHLEMPGPMLSILAALDKMPAGNALYVYHKRVPVFLLPELKEKGFDYRIKEKSDSEVDMLIFKS